MEFTIEAEYKKYLELMELSEDAMPEVQKTETIRAFYGGFSQALLLVMEVTEKTDEHGYVKAMTGLYFQANEFWRKENKPM